MQKKPYDALIIGAGVIGLTQAVALVQAGFRVAVVDAQVDCSLRSLNPPYDTYDTRVFALNHYSQQILEQLGVWQKINPAQLAAYHQVKLAFASQTPQLHLQDTDEAEPDLGHIVEQRVWRQAALEILEASELCEFFWGAMLEAVTTSKAQSSAVIPAYAGIHVNDRKMDSRVRGNDGHGEANLQIHTHLLIGADGVHSKVRELCDIKTDDFPCNQTALVFNIHVEKPHHFEARQYFSHQGIVAFLPLPDAHYYSIVWSIPNDQLWIKGLSDQALAIELNNICGKAWGTISIASKRQSFPLIQRQAKHYVLPQVALIGDAAHAIHPLAGQGANLGIADVQALTERLTLAQKQHRPLGDLTILKPYERTRRSAAWQMMLLMSGLKKCATRSMIFNQALNYGNLFLNRFPPLKNLLLRFALQDFTK